MAKKSIIRKETIPVAENVLGQVAISYNAGGNYNSGFSSSDMENFDVVDEGEVEIRDPERSYLTTTLFPLTFTEKVIAGSSIEFFRVVLTDNLYANFGFTEANKMSATNLGIPTFKRVLREHNYYSSFYRPDSFSTSPTDVAMTLRNVLIQYTTKEESFKTAIQSLSMTIRSVLIEYLYWKPESFKTSPTALTLPVSTIYSTKFKSLVIGDSRFVSNVVSDDVVTIKDAGVLTWQVPTTMNVDRTSPKAGNQSLIIDENYEYLASNESIGISSENGVELFFEDWFKPQLATTSLLTTYNYLQGLSEVPALVDKTGKFTWTSNKAFTTESYVLNKDDYIENTQSFPIPSPTISEKGTTIEINCKVEGSERIYLVSNNSSSFNTALGESLALVWYGASDTNSNKVALISDKTSLVDANNNILVSTDTYPSGSTLQIAVVAFEGYYRLFVNGVLQAVKAVTSTLNFGYNSKMLIGKCPWYAYTQAHTLTVYAFRFTKIALYTVNYTPSSVYSMSVVPDIPKLTDTATKFSTGISCGLRYDQSNNTVYVFASITDTYSETFTVRSTPIDSSKWNYVQLANNGNELTLFINGIANTSKKLPYNIKFKDVLIGNRESSNFKGEIDNFRIYSKLKDTSRYLRSSELFATHGGANNTNLIDANGYITWLPNRTLSFRSNALAIRGVEVNPSTTGLYTTSAQTLINSSYFRFKLGLTYSSFSSATETAVINAQTAYSGVDDSIDITYSQDKVLNLQFSCTSSATGTLFNTSPFSITSQYLTDTAFTIKFVFNGVEYPVENPLKTGVTYRLTILKLNNKVLFYLNDIQYASISHTLSFAFTTFAVTSSFDGYISKLSTYPLSEGKHLLDNYDVENGNGLNSKIYEVLPSKFLMVSTFNEVTYLTSTLLVGEGYHLTEVSFDTNKLSHYIDDVEVGVSEESYFAGSNSLYVLNNYLINNTLPFGLSYFSAESSKQDAILNMPYDITKIINESIYDGVVLNLSSDSLYNQSIIVDRSANPYSLDIINNGVSKAIKEPGFYFDGTGDYLKTTSPDFAFGIKDFYIELEIKVNNTVNRAVILDRYSPVVGSWQVSINSDGHLFFTVTTEGSYYYWDIPATLNDNKWHKVQVSRSGVIFKFYVDDVEIYEQNTGSVIDFSNTTIPLHIGYQGTAVNTAYNLTGYLNNIRIVKGYSLESDTTATSIDTVAYSQYTTYVTDTNNTSLVTDGVAISKGTSANVITNNGLTLGAGSSYGDSDVNSLYCPTPNTTYATTTLDTSASNFILSFDLLATTRANNGYAIPVLQLGSSSEGGDGFGFSLFSPYDGTVVAYVRNGYSNLTSLVFTLGVWNHVSIVKEDAAIYFYLNGIKSGSISTSSLATSLPLKIGGMSGAWLESRPIYFDNIRYAKGSISLADYATENGTEASGSENTGQVETYGMYSTSSSTLLNLQANATEIKDAKGNTLTNSNSVTRVSMAAPNLSNVIQFSGSNYLSVPTTNIDTLYNAQSEFTIEGSFATTSKTAGQTLIRTLNGSTSKLHFEVKIADDFKGLIFTVNTNSGTQDFKANFKVDLSTWYKFAITVSGSVVLIHINNDLYRFTSNINSWTAREAPSGTIYIGSSFTGFIEALKITNKALYSINKGVENLNRTSHIDFSRDYLVDSGNTPLTWDATNLSFADIASPRRALRYGIFTPSTTLVGTNSLYPSKSAFGIGLDVVFTTLASVENILQVNFAGGVLKIEKDTQVLKATFTDTENEILGDVSLPIASLKSGINNIALYRDFSSSLTLLVNTYSTTTANFGADLLEGSLTLGGFDGNVYDLNITNFDTLSKQFVLNTTKLTFEKSSVKTGYVADSNNRIIYSNNGATEVKGLSTTSDTALYFDGVASHLKTSSIEKFNFGATEDFEISVSFYPTNGNNNYQTLIANNISTFATSGCAYLMMYGNAQPPHLVTAATNRVAFGVSSSTNELTNPILLSTSQCAFNTWHFVKITRVNGVLNLYLNGVLEKSVTNSSAFDFSTNGFLVGKNGWDGPAGYFEGYIDDLKIAERGSYADDEQIQISEGLVSAIDFEDVGVSYEVIESAFEPDYVDNYYNTWSIGRYDASSVYPYFKTVSAVNEAIYFPGKGFLYNFNEHFTPGLDPFSLSVDFMQVTRSSLPYIVALDPCFNIRIDNTTLYVTFQGTTVNLGLANLNTWYTVAVCRDSNNTFRVFLNGKVKATYTNWVTNVDQGTSFYPLVLGRRWDYRNHPSYTYEYFYGYIDNFYYERGYAKYTADYVVSTDKSDKLVSNSLLNYYASGPLDTNTQLTWSSSGVSTVTGYSQNRTYAGRNTATGSYLQSSAHGLALNYTDFTLDLYFRPSQTLAESCLVDLSVDAVTQQGIKIIQSTSSAASITVQIGATGASEWSLTMNTGTNTLTNNVTYHLRLTRNLGTIYLFLDGTLKATSDFLSPISIGSTFTLFNNISRNKGFNGAIEQFRFKQGCSFAAQESFTKLTGELK